jgi:MSHA biogenesis protein MshG
LALYQYKARGHTGDAVQGVIEAASSDAVASQLIENGLTPVIIEPTAKPVENAIRFEKLFPAKVLSGDLIQFSRQMHSLLKAGVPILTAFSGLAEITKNETMRDTIKSVSISLESGRDLATSMNEHPEVFNMFYVSMIRIGETSGNLDAIFLQVAKYLERDKKTRDQIKSAVRYPVFVLTSIVVAMSVINLFVIPAFSKLFAKYNADLPWATQILMATSTFTVNHWPELLAALVGGIVWLRYYVGTEKGRYRWDKQKLKLPVVGDLIHRSTMARFARLFSMSTRSGVPLITALTVVARALDNKFVEARVLSMQTGIERGESISNTAAATGMFDHLVLQMMSVGEQTGAMDELLLEVAEYYDSEVEYELERLSAAIEPLLTIIIGFIVLILALGVFLPMWNIANVALHK